MIPDRPLTPPDAEEGIKVCRECGKEFYFDERVDQPYCEECRPRRAPPLPKDQPITDTPAMLEAIDFFYVDERPVSLDDVEEEMKQYLEGK